MVKKEFRKKITNKKNAIKTCALAMALCGSLMMVGTPSVAHAAPDSVVGSINEATNITTDGFKTDEQVTITATKASNVTVSIPKTITLEKSGNGFSGGFHVDVKGDIAGDQNVIVTPPKTVVMTQDGKNGEITATLELASKEDSFVTTANDLLKGEQTMQGSVKTTDATVGTWHGTSNFHIELAQK